MFQPRDQHYFFVHDFIKDLYFELSDDLRYEKVISIIESPNIFIKNIWRNFYHLAEIKDQYIPEDSLTLEYINTDTGLEIGLITLPEAERPTEAHYVGMVFCNGENNKMIYFTLEKTFEGNPIICFWTEDNSHHNTGVSIPEDKDMFLDEILKMYKRININN